MSFTPVAKSCSKPSADDDGPDMNVVVHRLKRIVEIWKLLNHQVDVLETMTPLDFLDFRSSASRAPRVFKARSSARSKRLWDCGWRTVSGPITTSILRWEASTPADYQTIVEAEKTTTLLQLVEHWLVRMPFFEESFWTGLGGRDGRERKRTERIKFWNRYRKLYEASLSDRDEKADLLGKFDETFFKTGAGDFSPASLRAALFIMLYRDEPLFRLPFALLNTLDRDRRTAGKFSLSPSPNGPANDRNAGSALAEAAANNISRAR